ncbi:hypothetical protein L6Q96_09680 [Candidatus Binatia bacterium]|nr:hypothetical protein [Candidatus Binatia bacterium]
MSDGTFLIIGNAGDSCCTGVAEALSQLGHDVIRTTDPLTESFSLCVRDLETLLGHVLARKHPGAEAIKNWKIEKWEGSKLESIKSDLGKFEHGELKGGFESGPDRTYTLCGAIWPPGANRKTVGTTATVGHLSRIC